MTVFDLTKNSDWEIKNSGFMVAGSKIVWESAVYAHRCDKVVISRVVGSGGKPFLLGLGYIKRYVLCGLLVTKLIKRTEKGLFEG